VPRFQCRSRRANRRPRKPLNLSAVFESRNSRSAEPRSRITPATLRRSAAWARAAGPCDRRARGWSSLVVASLGAVECTRLHAALLETGVQTRMGKDPYVQASHKAPCSRARYAHRVSHASRKDIPFLRLLDRSKAVKILSVLSHGILLRKAAALYHPLYRKRRPNSPVVLARGRAQPGASAPLAPLTRRRHARCNSLLQETPSVAAAGAPRRLRRTEAACSTLERRWGDAATAHIGHFSRLNCENVFQPTRTHLRRQRPAHAEPEFRAGFEHVS
jgi:hypothetical protein